MIIGGALSANNAAVYRAILDGRSGSGPFCIIPTAGATPDSAMASPIATFDRHGGAGTATGVLISASRPETARDPGVVEQIHRCSGFFFIGGVQSRVTAAFRPEGKSTPAYEALMRRWREGAVVSGSSAGAAIMSDPMIAGGASDAAMTRGVRRITYSPADGDDSTGGVTLAPGLGLFSSALADQHFLARGRFGRLVVAILDEPRFDLAFGVDENTALVVDRDSVMAVGASGVVVFDERSARRSGASVDGITMHLLGTGDRFDLRRRTVTFAPAKSRITVDPSTPALTAPANPFGRFELLKVLDRFARSARSDITMPMQGGGRIVLRKQGDFSAVASPGIGVQDTRAGLGITGMRLDVIR
ncbi:MAG TPA: cyanophycinase [Gemmatimonadaceae bacterium]|nr:cyanophycinase [Gemmatimonadaceae bacterium]